MQIIVDGLDGPYFQLGMGVVRCSRTVFTVAATEVGGDERGCLGIKAIVKVRVTGGPCSSPAQLRRDYRMAKTVTALTEPQRTSHDIATPSLTPPSDNRNKKKRNYEVLY